MMAFVRPILRSAIDRSGDPVEALERTNRILVEERRTGLFVTVLAGILDLDSGGFAFANGGHEPPLLVRGDGSGASLVLGSGPLLGMFDRLHVPLETIELQRGDALVLYTDGITDAASPSGERFGEARFVEALGGFAGTRLTPAATTCRAVIDSVAVFQGGAEPADDLALLILHREPSPARDS